MSLAEAKCNVQFIIKTEADKFNQQAGSKQEHMIWKQYKVDKDKNVNQEAR